MSRANGDGLRRLDGRETQQQLETDATPLGTVVDVDGRPVDEPVQIPLAAPVLAVPAPVRLPVSSSARIGEIRSEGATTAAAISQRFVDERADAVGAHAAAVAELRLYREQRDAAEERLGELLGQREEFVASLPGRLRRRIGQPISRLAGWAPWAMLIADTLIMANAYGAFGMIALPVPPSTYLANLVQLLRAVAVSFVLVFGLRAAGCRLRVLAEDLRERSPTVARLLDFMVIGTVVGSAVLLAFSAAQLQAAFLAVLTGRTQVVVPTLVLFGIVCFLGAVSFAVGYISTEPELARVASLDAQITVARAKHDEVRERLLRQAGVVRGLRAKLAAVNERERLELEEHRQHTERRVYAHMNGNTSIYGLAVDAKAARVPGRSS